MIDYSFVYMENSTFLGGKKVAVDVEKFAKHGGNIVIGTPGRLEDMLVGKSVG